MPEYSIYLQTRLHEKLHSLIEVAKPTDFHIYSYLFFSTHPTINTYAMKLENALGR